MSYTPIDTTLLRYSNSMIQHAITSPLLWYNNLICYYSPIDTTNYYVNILLLIQQSHSTILQLIQQLICSLTHQHWYNNPLQYYISIDSASYYVHTTISILWYWYSNLNYYYSTMIPHAFYDRTILLIQTPNKLLYKWYNNLNP